MKPATSDQNETLRQLRQQLILAQVRIMELEDERDLLTPRLQEREALLKQALSLADQKLDEASHLEKVLSETRQNHDDLRALQSKTSHELQTVLKSLALTKTEISGLQNATRQLELALQHSNAEITAIKSTRSWRWTAWFRSLGAKSDRKQA